MRRVASQLRMRKRREIQNEQSGEQSDMHSRDDEEVEGAGALEAETKLLSETGAVAEEHCVDHSGVIWREAKTWRKAAICVGDQCRREGVRRPSFERRRCGIAGLLRYGLRKGLRTDECVRRSGKQMELGGGTLAVAAIPWSRR